MSPIRLQFLSRLATSLAFILTAAILVTAAQGQCRVGLYSTTYQTPDDCKSMVLNNYQYYFNITQLCCMPCTQQVTEQTVSADGTSCVCTDAYRLTQNFGGQIQCVACPENEVTSFSGWECVACSDVNQTTPTVCPTCNAAENLITVERQLNGLFGEPSRMCETCANDTSPDAAGRQCLRCNQALAMGETCACTRSASGLCFADADNIPSINAFVSFGNTPYFSAYFNAYASGAALMCTQYNNQTACELLANLCTLTLYRYTPPSGQIPTACSYYQSVATVYWPTSMPWLYYNPPPAATTALSDTSIPTRYTFPSSTLQFLVGSYALNGSFLGYTPLSGGALQLCKNSVPYMDAAFVFGTYFSQLCTTPVPYFWDEVKYPPVLFDLWLEYTANNVQLLYAVPILVTNLIDANGQTINTGTDETRWQLVRRFFLVDNISGKSASGAPNSQPVHYAATMTINVQLQGSASNESGRIFPPYLQITYAALPGSDSSSNNKTVSLSFEVAYTMSYGSYQQNSSIALGVLSAVCVLYAVLRTWAWWRRGRRYAVDFITMIKFVLFALGYVANALFVVTLGAAIWWLVYYKKQNNVQVVLSPSVNSQYTLFLILGFVFKLVDLVHSIIVQTTVDVFLIDWERPDTRRSNKGSGAVEGGPQRVEQPVSIWRSYFVANEWNEIQTQRVTVPNFTIFATVFFLEVVGFGNLATAQPGATWSLGGDVYYAPMNSMLRFALIGSVYLLIVIAEWLYFTLIHERFFEDPVRSYVDFCSTTNVSVLLMESDTFGYYIHGRSVHGRADTGLRQMHENMEREKRDLCGQRGLVPGSQHQTFRVAFPKKLKTKYDRIMIPTVMMQQAGGAAVAGARARRPGGAGGAGLEGGADASIKLDPHTELCIEAYRALNRLLQDFIDHSLKDVDYIVKDRVLLEQLLDIEFQQPLPERGIFYNDNGHAFDSVLYYGNEILLVVFEVLFLGIVDLGTHNYFLDGFLLYILMEVLVKKIRIGLGRMNLAKKTLVDKRFLI